VSGGRVRPGDTLRLAYRSPRYRNLTIFSLNAQGRVVFYGPDPTPLTSSVDIKPAVLDTFPAPVVLDSVPGKTLFLAIFSVRPLGSYKVKPWMENQFKAGSGNLGLIEKGLRYQSLFAMETFVRTFWIVKE
jgi:hypothetical protein